MRYRTPDGRISEFTSEDELLKLCNQTLGLSDLEVGKFSLRFETSKHPISGWARVYEVKSSCGILGYTDGHF